MLNFTLFPTAFILAKIKMFWTIIIYTLLWWKILNINLDRWLLNIESQLAIVDQFGNKLMATAHLPCYKL